MTTANLPPEARALDLRCREKLSRLVKRGDFTAKAGETWLVTDLEGIHAERVLLVGSDRRPPLRRTQSRARPGAAPSPPPSARPRARASPRWRWRCRALRPSCSPTNASAAPWPRSPATRCIASTISRAARSRAPMRSTRVVVARRPKRAGAIAEGLRAGQRARLRRRAHAQPRQPSRQRLHALATSRRPHRTSPRPTSPCA